MRKNICKLCLLLCCLLSPFLVGTATASAEQVYLVTEMELLQLQDNLTTLEQQRQVLLNELKLLAKENEQLEQDLIELKVLSQTQEMQLKTVNESLQEYAKEEKRKLSKVKRQRNIGYIIAAGILYCYVKEVKN